MAGSECISRSSSSPQHGQRGAGPYVVLIWLSTNPMDQLSDTWELGRTQNGNAPQPMIGHRYNRHSWTIALSTATPLLSRSGE